MAHYSPLIAPHLHHLDKIIVDPAPEVPALEEPSPPVDPDQVRALEAVFAAKERESATVAGILSLWTGTMLLNDLAIEALSEPAGEVEPDRPKPQPRRKD